MLIASALALGFPARSPAQVEEADAGAPGGGQIDVKVVNFGVGGGPGGAARSGEWCGVQIEILSRLEKHKNVIVQIPEFDPDGDVGLRQRDITANPGKRERVWLYTRLPFKSVNSLVFRVTVHEAKDLPSGTVVERGEARFLPGRLYGSTTFKARDFVSSQSGMVAVVGQSVAGLDQYSNTLQGMDYIPTGHELIRTIGGLTPADLPDRWQGLATFDALVWTAASAAGRPLDLSLDQSAAIREWVRRGGHLIVVLPNAGQEWLGHTDHLLTGLMPAVEVRTEEGVEFAPYRPLLVSDPKNRSPLPRKATIHFFEPDPGAAYGEAMRVLSGPDGRCVVCRRLVGAGAVTFIGINIASDVLRSGGVIEADAIWNRVLGKRVDLLSPAELGARSGRGVMNSKVALNRTPRYFEGRIGTEIQKKTRAAAGLFLAFVVFLAYWLLAGPLGYLGLRRRGLKQHAWVAFLGAAGVFTGVAWGGANWLKPRRVEVSHLSFLDHIYGQPSERARCFVNVLLPGYGDEFVGVEQSAGSGLGSATGERWHDAITPWDAPPLGGMGSDAPAFPDARGYYADGRDPDMLRVPTRATVKQFQIDWAGAPRWRMPTPVSADGDGGGGEPVAIGSEIRLEETPGVKPGWRLTGTLTHNLPGPLTDVVIIVVRRQAALGDTSPTLALVGLAAAIIPPNALWEPGKPLDLAATVREAAAGEKPDLGASGYFAKLLPPPTNYDQIRGIPTLESGTSRSIQPDLIALSFYSMLPPPAGDNPNYNAAWVVRRELTHSYDLGRWFTQPCLIIVGQLVDCECPAPILVGGVGGKAVSSTGRTVVRWVYPLGDDPPEFKEGAGVPMAPASPSPVEDQPEP